jgi:ADP-ribosylglycohydrolase
MAIENKHLITGLEGTVEQSKGNGANIRCPWLGLLNLPDNTIASLAVLQASVSHNHPLALAGAAVTSLVVSALLRGDVVPGHGALYQHAIAITERLINDQPSFWLGTNYSQGLTDLLAFLKKSGSGIDAFNKTDDTEDAADHLYQGWVAEEALVMAITIVDHYAGVPVAGMRRLVHSTGDTDSTGAIAGAFFGAAFGNDIWPAEWALNLEPRYAKELQELTVAINSQPEEYKLAE